LTGGVISALFMGIRFRQQSAFISSRSKRVAATTRDDPAEGK